MTSDAVEIINVMFYTSNGFNKLGAVNNKVEHIGDIVCDVSLTQGGSLTDNIVSGDIVIFCPVNELFIVDFERRIKTVIDVGVIIIIKKVINGGNRFSRKSQGNPTVDTKVLGGMAFNLRD